jgi:hypothetical protein
MIEAPDFAALSRIEENLLVAKLEATRLSIMDYYFIKPLERANVGFLIQTSASIGMAGVLQLMGTVIRNIIGRMEGQQLLSICGSIRQLMR